MKKLIRRASEIPVLGKNSGGLLKRLTSETLLPRFRREIDDALDRMWRKLSSHGFGPSSPSLLKFRVPFLLGKDVQPVKEKGWPRNTL